MKIRILVEPNEDGGFTAFVPALPGCIAEGDTPDEAACEIGPAVEQWIASEWDDDFAQGDGVEIRDVHV